MCQYRFNNCNKYMTLMGNADNGGGCACVGGREYMENHCTFLSVLTVNLKLL